MDTCATASFSYTDLLNRPFEPSEWEAFVATMDDVSQDEQSRPQQTEPIYQQEDVVISLDDFGPLPQRPQQLPLLLYRPPPQPSTSRPPRPRLLKGSTMQC